MRVAFVFARGGSKGIPKKNLQIVGNLTLLEHSVVAAKASRLIDAVMVSTDDPEIREFALSYGALCPELRPPELATDSSPELLSWRYAIKLYEQISETKIKTFVSLPPTSPLRSITLIDTQIDEFEESGCDISFSVVSSDANPYFNMVEEKNSGISLVKPEEKFFRRQDAPKVYTITTCCYVAKPEYILKQENLFGGKVNIFAVPKENSIDIDDKLDLEMANLLFSRAKR